MIIENVFNLIEEVKLGLSTREAARSHVGNLRAKRAYSSFINADLNTKAKIIAKGVPTSIKHAAPSIASMTVAGGFDIPDAIKVGKEIKADPSRIKSPSYLGGVAARLWPGSGVLTAAKALTHDPVIHGTKQLGLEQRRAQKQ
jgi:hypothetical protein